MHRLLPLLVLLLAASASAQAPRTITYQGVLEDGGVPVTTETTFKFTLFDAETGGTAQWGVQRTVTPSPNGTFVVYLGTVEPLDLSFAEPLWLEVIADGEALGPRTEVASVPYALGLYGVRVTPPADPNNAPSIAAGHPSNASGVGAVVAGGGTADAPNTASGTFAAIGGGSGNGSNGLNATVAGGEGNTASSSWATVGGGDLNTASGQRATVAGGRENMARGTGAAIGGGISNLANNFYTTVGGGFDNDAIDDYATISGGRENTASDNYATIGGGQLNTAEGDYVTIAGGYQNVTRTQAATVGGGYRNMARGPRSVIAGGVQNTASDSSSTIGGGYSNDASGPNSTVSGGSGNDASGSTATVGGGNSNRASGSGSTVPGGYKNYARGAYSFAAGNHARAAHDGTFVWADKSQTFSDSLVSTAQNQFLVRAAGGVGIGTNAPANQLSVNGSADFAGDVGVGTSAPTAAVHIDHNSSSADPHLLLEEQSTTGFARLTFRNGNAAGNRWTLAAGFTNNDRLNVFTRGRNVVQFFADSDDGGTEPDLIRTSAGGARLTQGGVWTNASSVHLKTDFEAVDPEAVLATLARVPVTRWRYRAEADDVWHLGPMSQDFHAAFGLGSTDEAIGTVDADGVALAAAQALAARTEAQAAEIAALRADRDRLGAEVAALEGRLGDQRALIEAQAARLDALVQRLEALAAPTR